jgi:hypothetical protein
MAKAAVMARGLRDRPTKRFDKYFQRSSDAAAAQNGLQFQKDSSDTGAHIRPMPTGSNVKV